MDGDLARVTKEILAKRKQQRLERAAEVKALGKYRKKLRKRLDGGEWPIDAATGEKADLDPEDVRATIPDDMKAPLGDIDERMQELRAEADQHQSFAGPVVPIDETLLAYRRAERQREVEARASVRGDAWTEELVEARVEEAFKTLFRATAGPVGPRAFGNAMPTPIRQMADLVSQAGNKSLRRAAGRLLRDRGPPSTDEIQRMDDALMWAVRYLRDYPEDMAMFVNLSGLWKASGAKVTKRCAELGISRPAFYRDRKEAIRVIVEGLKRDGKAPT